MEGVSLKLFINKNTHTKLQIYIYIYIQHSLFSLLFKFPLKLYGPYNERVHLRSRLPVKLDPKFTNKVGWHHLCPCNPNIKSKQALLLTSKQMVLLASEIIAWSNTKLVTILSVVLDMGVDTRFCTHNLILKDDQNDHSYTQKIIVALHELLYLLHIIKMITRF